jgi:hypothetical protein
MRIVVSCGLECLGKLGQLAACAADSGGKGLGSCTYAAARSSVALALWCSVVADGGWGRP